MFVELPQRNLGCFFEESAELLRLFYKQTWLMARYNAQEVLDRVWNDSGSEGSISDSDYAHGNSNSDSESEEWSGDSAETSESSDTESGDESEESNNEPPARNNPNPRRRRGQPHQDQPALQWTPANMERPHAFPFTGSSGIQVRTVGFGPIDSLFINQDLINYFVTETSRFAEQFISGDDLSRRSRANSWHPTDPHEMKQFLGLLFLTGIIRKPAINLYWSTDPLYSIPLFGAIMSRNRFQLLLKFLNFNDNA